MPNSDAGWDEQGEMAVLDAPESVEVDVKTATAQVRDLLTLAEVATIRGRPTAADYWMRRAEHTALRTGFFSVMALVWDQRLLS